MYVCVYMYIYVVVVSISIIINIIIIIIPVVGVFAIVVVVVIIIITCLIIIILIISFSPEQALSPAEGIREGNGVRLPVERLEAFAEQFHAAVSVVVGFAPQLLQLLPDDEEAVQVAVVQEEDGVVGAVLQGGHGVLVAAAHQVVDVVVSHLELHLHRLVHRISIDEGKTRWRKGEVGKFSKMDKICLWWAAHQVVDVVVSHLELHLHGLFTGEV